MCFIFGLNLIYSRSSSKSTTSSSSRAVAHCWLMEAKVRQVSISKLILVFVPHSACRTFGPPSNLCVYTRVHCYWGGGGGEVECLGIDWICVASRSILKVRRNYWTTQIRRGWNTNGIWCNQEILKGSEVIRRSSNFSTSYIWIHSHCEKENEWPWKSQKCSLFLSLPFISSRLLCANLSSMCKLITLTTLIFIFQQEFPMSSCRCYRVIHEA